MNNRVNLRIDFAFKQLFGTKGNEDILMGFLNAVLQKTLSSPITGLMLEDTYLYKECNGDKLSIMDVQATLETGAFVNIGIQIADKYDMQKRSLYYWSKLYASQVQEGRSYSELQKAIMINVLDFGLYSNHEQFQTTGVLWDTEKEFCINRDIEIHYIELPKLIALWRGGEIDPWQGSLVRWLLLLVAHEDKSLTETLEAIAMEQDGVLQQAIQKWDNMSCNQEFRREYEVREKMLLDEKASVAHAEQKGIEKGIEEGKAHIIRNMYESGMRPQVIANITKLTVEEVQCMLQLS
ncbi:Rpn family recombination-promoting nuclease/putative transposase [Bacillus thuringiensis]